MKRWTCPLCNKSVAWGFTVTGEIITAHREVYLREATTVCGACMPTTIRTVASVMNEGVARLMQGYGGPYDSTKDLPIVGGVRIEAQWGVPEENTP